MTDKALTVRDDNVSVVGGPSAAIIQMLEHGLDTGKIEKMLELQERWEANEARKAFYSDMSFAQSEMPKVVEDKYNDQTKSDYSSYKALAAACKPVYTKHGLSLIFYESDCPKNDYIRVCVDVVHRMGHKETYHADIPVDISGIAGKVNKTKPHAKGSSFSYGRAYLMKLVFNLPTGDDDDGNAAGAPVEFITDEQVKTITKLVKSTKTDEKAFLTFAQAETIDTIKSADFAKIMRELNRKVAAMKKKPSEREPGSDDE